MVGSPDSSSQTTFYPSNSELFSDLAHNTDKITKYPRNRISVGLIINSRKTGSVFGDGAVSDPDSHGNHRNLSNAVHVLFYHVFNSTN